MTDVAKIAMDVKFCRAALRQAVQRHLPYVYPYFITIVTVMGQYLMALIVVVITKQLSYTG
jgi:hypothetical protein